MMPDRKSTVWSGNMLLKHSLYDHCNVVVPLVIVIHILHTAYDSIR